MKRTLLVILTALALSACSIMPEADVPEFEDLDHAWYWIKTNIEYVSDMEAHGKRDYWQYAYETIELGTGDCEDICILFLDIAKKQFGMDLEAGLVSWIEDGERIGHMHPKVNGEYFAGFFMKKEGFIEDKVLDYPLLLSIIRLYR